MKLPFLDKIPKEDRKKLVLLLAAAIVLVIVLIINNISDKKKQQEINAIDPIPEREQIMEIPDAEVHDVLDAQNTTAARESQRRNRSSSLRDLYASGGTDSDGDPMSSPDKQENPGTITDDDVRKSIFGDDADEPEQEAPKSRVNSAPPARKKINVNTASTMLDTPEPAPEPEPVVEPEPVPQPVAPAPEVQKRRRSGGIMSLEDGDQDGISSVDGDDQYVIIDENRPVKVMFVRDQKVSSGERVSLRLLEDIAADNILIPKNTHLSAQCNIGERLKLTVSNIEINGRILELGYTAFDNDGSEGLYCPETNSRKAAKQAESQASAIGSALSGMYLPGFAGQIVNAGSQIVKSAGSGSGASKVTAQVKSGYTFYLLKD